MTNCSDVAIAGLEIDRLLAENRYRLQSARCGPEAQPISLAGSRIEASASSPRWSGTWATVRETEGRPPMAPVYNLPTHPPALEEKQAFWLGVGDFHVACVRPPDREKAALERLSQRPPHPRKPRVGPHLPALHPSAAPQSQGAHNLRREPTQIYQSSARPTSVVTYSSFMFLRRK